MKSYESVTDALDDLKKKGYEADFATETVCLYCGDLDIRLNPDEFHVDEIYKVERDPDHENNSAVYAISSAEGLKGTLVDSYVPDPQNLSFEMAMKLNTNPASI